MKSVKAFLLLIFSLLLSCTPSKEVLSLKTSEALTPSQKAAPTCEDFLNDPQNEVNDPIPQLSQDAHRRWLEKASRALRNGRGLTRKDPIDELMKMSRLQVIELWMKDPAFDDTVLDFSLSLWGQRVDSLRRGDYLKSQIFLAPSAVFATQNFIKNEDYFGSLFELYPPAYQSVAFPPLNGEEPDDHKIPEHELRLRLKERTLKDIDNWVEFFTQRPATSDADFCRKLEQLIGTGIHFNRFINFGLLDFVPSALFSPSENWYNRTMCLDPNPNSLSIDPIATLRNIRERDEKFFDAAIKYIESFKPPRSVQETTVLHLPDLTITKMRATAFGPVGFTGLRATLPNSSTNMNRKRANFILERFFCDNMTPINVEDPGQHAGNHHISETSCRSCHYKLDPMAGFFANTGYQFEDLSGHKNMIFDDFAVTDRETYVANWFNTESKTWDIGYFRSPTQKEHNTYGRSLEDLFQIIRTAPEVKRCLTKRSFEYFVAANQVIDSGYLDYIAQEFSCVAEKNSSEALRRNIKRLLLSRSFIEKNLEADQCYDFPPGHQEGDTPPCKVAAILQKNCIECHKSTTGDGRLDLSRWIRTADGELNFPHVNRQGQQKKRKDTLSKMQQLISTPDEDRRMPKDRFMHPLERETLYLWLNEELSK